jgi:hypothetical protein
MSAGQSLVAESLGELEDDLELIGALHDGCNQ